MILNKSISDYVYLQVRGLSKILFCALKVVIMYFLLLSPNLKLKLCEFEGNNLSKQRDMPVRASRDE